MPNIVLAYDGSDRTQDTSGISVVSGTFASATDRQRTGPRSLKATMSGTNCIGQFSNVLADAGRRISFGVNFDSVAWSGTNPLMLRFQTTAPSNLVASMQFQTGTAQLRFQPAGATAVNGTATLSANAWHRIAIAFVITNTTTFEFRVYVDGVLDITCTAGTMTRVGAAHLEMLIPSGAGATKNVWYDDVYADAGTDLADPGAGLPYGHGIRIADNRDLYNTLNSGFQSLQKAA